ncbi:MAG TPA: hypothetical protein VIG88_01255, partial [Lysobacter sp.]
MASISAAFMRRRGGGMSGGDAARREADAVPPVLADAARFAGRAAFVAFAGRSDFAVVARRPRPGTQWSSPVRAASERTATAAFFAFVAGLRAVDATVAFDVAISRASPVPARAAGPRRRRAEAPVRRPARWQDASRHRGVRRVAPASLHEGGSARARRV